ncbi:MAG: tetratricopeptide repeat protein [Candidatus Aminicenantes bacterium]|nr:MAG: tetratricopeptide repeat protein [Candidatus Aminicenantes bacterium]
MDKKTLSFLLLLSFLFLMLFARCSPPPPQSQLHFGVLAAQRDLWDEAIFRWKKAVVLEPESSSAHNNLAVAYEKKGLWEEARKEYEAAIKLNPKNEYIQSNYEKFKRRMEEGATDEEDENKDKKKKKQ